MTATPTITAFAASPDEGAGLARDTRVRWALEEVGQPYDVRFLSFAELKEADYLAWHPFGQIPAYREGEFELFESGAIVLRIAETHAGLLPTDERARSRAIMWMFAALSSVEPAILDQQTAVLVEQHEPWAAQRLPQVLERLRGRLGQLADALGDRDWLEREFSAGDLMMIEVIKRVEEYGILADFPTLAAYVARGQDRPAFQRAFAAQKAAFAQSQGN